VDLEGAKFGSTPNLATIEKIVKSTNLFVEVGGGIRSLDVIETYIRIGVNRVILGTSAVTDPEFLVSAVAKYGDKIAVGVDIKDGYVAIKGWTEKSDLEAFAFCEKLEKLGVKTVICTDISKDGAMQGANHSLYEQLSKKFSIDFIASGGVSSIEDVNKLAKQNMYGAIIGKAYYTSAINLNEAIEVAKNVD
jgi:phosphoribosylformimino-5-aminoimidazole carboxamide ribotide isomerase